MYVWQPVVRRSQYNYTPLCCIIHYSVHSWWLPTGRNTMIWLKPLFSDSFITYCTCTVCGNGLKSNLEKINFTQSAFFSVFLFINIPFLQKISDHSTVCLTTFQWVQRLHVFLFWNTICVELSVFSSWSLLKCLIFSHCCLWLHICMHTCRWCELVIQPDLLTQFWDILWMHCSQPLNLLESSRMSGRRFREHLWVYYSFNCIYMYV